MNRRSLILFIVMALVAFGAQAATIDGGAHFLERLDTAVATGEIDQEQALLYEFYYGFDHDALPVAWRPVDFPPLKCGTDLMHRFEELRPTLSSETIKIFEAQLTPSLGDTKATYLSPLGHCNLTYLTTGTDAVPTTDVDPANGIPDFVERCATYMDTSWETEIVSMGFTAPPSHPYQVSFESMSYYGYTTVVTGTVTRIVLHNNFLGFPPNDDPAGNAIGAAKVTCAHEFKHASQRAQSGWSEGGWVELDATWMEDIVYDEVNDYYNYLPSGSGISSPGTSLDSGGSGSYEDCIWQHWMSETYGNQIVIDFWDRRSTHTGEAVLASYHAILGLYGSSLAQGYADFGSWNLATGAHALNGVGYGEAFGYPTSPSTSVGTYPNTQSGTLAHLAAQNIYSTNFGGQIGTVDVDFNGQDGRAMGLIAMIRKTDATAVVETITLDANSDAVVSLSTPMEQISWVGFAVVNGELTNTAGWTLIINANIDTADPIVQLAMNSVATQLDYDEQSFELVNLANVGAVGSTLNYATTVMDLNPGAKVLAAVAPRHVAVRPRAGIGELDKPNFVAPDADKYAGDCIYGNDDTGNIQGHYSSWWTGNETYAYKIDPTAGGCGCGVGFNVRAVHMMIYLEAASTPSIQAHLAADAGACAGPGAIIDTSPAIAVSGITTSGYYDIEVPCDFVCTDVDAGPYYILFEFLDANGPVGICVDSTPTSCVNFNEWDATGFNELVDGYTFAGDLLIWADVDCCGTAVPEVTVVAPNGGEFLAQGSVFDLSWTALVLTDLKVELSRDNGGAWETLYASTPNDGQESWTVTGPSSSQCLLKISSLDDTVVDVSDAPFTIYGNVPWLFINPASGAIADGASVDLIFGFDSTGLPEAVYTGWVLIEHDAAMPAEVIEVTLTVSHDTAVGAVPMVFRMEGNHPNPFNPATTLRFSLAVAGSAVVDVVDLQGRVVRTLHRGDLPAGATNLVWDGRDDAGRSAASGTYMARLSSGGLTASHKMLLAK